MAKQNEQSNSDEEDTKKPKLLLKKKHFRKNIIDSSEEENYEKDLENNESVDENEIEKSSLKKKYLINKKQKN